ncbi:MAG: hypothetical protein Q4Q07_09225 [Tissierellia bacterium]|nr:hypothetical protein [Tissierellia bacterium]
MSQFLGMVHHMMYNKIMKREERMENLLSSLSKGKKEEILQKMESKGVLEKKPLEDIIDESNIHGWLNDKVIISEERLGIFLEEISKEMTKEELLERMKALGEKEVFSGSPKEGYIWIVQNILDGMPCDQGLVPIEESDRSFRFQVLHDLHAPYLPSNVVDLYWDCRKAFMEGAFHKSNLEYLDLGSNIYEIR